MHSIKVDWEIGYKAWIRQKRIREAIADENKRVIKDNKISIELNKIS